MATGNTEQLRLDEVTKCFSGKTVLDRISLSIHAGESVVVMGPSGCGKTVLLKHLIGLLTPDSGRVFVRGQDLWAATAQERNALRNSFGMAFQEGALFDSMTVFENVAFPLRRHTGASGYELRKMVEHSLSLVGLGAASAKRPSELSVGMRRRAGFARAIALQPQILLFDEPTAGLDPVMVTVLNQLIASLGKMDSVTTVVSTHDLRTAREVADRIVMLANGKIVADAPVEEFFDLPLPEVRQLIEGRVDGPLRPAEELGEAVQ
ncbi:MAG: ABC transporter ATP-binding protein [Myxococcaceae bacterium]